MATKEKQPRRKATAAKKRKVASLSADENSPAKDLPSEINEPRWSVVSFEKCAAKSLTYAEALKKLKQLEAKKVAGLCIITDEAARRISVNNKI